MKIDGTDPLTLNRVLEQTGKPEVQRPDNVYADARLKRREEVIRGRDMPREVPASYEEQVEEAVKQANRATEAVNIDLRFRVQDRPEQRMVQVYDRQDEQVIKEIPPEKLLSLVGHIQEMIGLILDETR